MGLLTTEAAGTCGNLLHFTELPGLINLDLSPDRQPADQSQAAILHVPDPVRGTAAVDQGHQTGRRDQLHPREVFGIEDDDDVVTIINPQPVEHLRSKWKMPCSCAR